MTSKDLVHVPAHATLIGKYEGTGTKIGNAFLLAISSFPATAFFGMGLDGSYGDIVLPVGMGSFLMLILYVMSPFEVKGVQQIEGKNFKQFLKLNLVKFPIVNRFVNERIEWTETDYYGYKKPEKRLTIVEKGKTSVYSLATIDPMELWDKMYLLEFGEDIEKGIAYHKSLRKIKTEALNALQAPSGGKLNTFLNRLLG